MGFQPDALPVYTDLDPSRFEDFCEALLNLNPRIPCLRQGRLVQRRIVEAKRLLQGVTQDGVDIQAQAEGGERWLFQCKHVQSFGQSQVLKAIEAAERGFPQTDQFVLVTACKLRTAAQNEIDKRPKWRSWSASDLTTQVLKLRPRENAINLVHQFFGPDDAKKLFIGSEHPLLKWNDFFGADLSKERLFFHHCGEFIPWSDALSKLETFAGDRNQRALILSAAGGQGKSRLLLEFARQSEAQGRRVRFLNLNQQGLKREQPEFLSREDEDLILVVDDAHRLDSALLDITQATAKNARIRLIIATRPQAHQVIKSRLYSTGYAEHIEELALRRWTSAEINKLAESVLDLRFRIQAAPLAALADRCPLLVVLGAALINSGKWPQAMGETEAFRERVFHGFKEEFLNRRSGAERERLDRLFRFIAFVSPCKKDDRLIETAAELLECSVFDVEDDLTLLESAEVLVENREGVRLYPDLFSDAVLLDACLDQSGGSTKLYRRITSRLSAKDFPALLRNLAQADWEARTKKGAKESLFDPIWNEFVRRFRIGKWPVTVRFSDFETTGERARFERDLETAREKDKARTTSEEAETPENTVSEADRAEMLNQWASFAIFLPKRTLELARLIMEETKSVPPDPDRPAYIEQSLPPLLKPIVVWHPPFARQALDLLWSLDASEPRGQWENSDSNPIAVIASAASFEFEKPLRVSETVNDWLDEKLKEQTSVDRLLKQPWILSGLLKPFFGRQVEHNWVTGRTMHILRRAVSAEKTRPLRKRTLEIAERFLIGQDLALCHAIIPIFEEAIRPLGWGFDSKPSQAEQELWRDDRLQVLRTIERAMQVHQNSAIILLRLRLVLRWPSQHDPDEAVREECCRVLKEMPETFELQVIRALISLAYDEFPIGSGMDSESRLRSAEAKWSAFQRSVARELADRLKTTPAVCSFIKRQIRELAAINFVPVGGALLDEVAALSSEWCSAILDEILNASDTMLDTLLSHVLRLAVELTPDAYRRAIDGLPESGRPEQISSMVRHLGWKHLHGGGLSEWEREAILEAAKRKEEGIVTSLAAVSGIHFSNEPIFAIELLGNLRPGNQREGSEILKALKYVTEKHSSTLPPEKVAQCLANLGAFSFVDNVSSDYDLKRLAQIFPKEAYEHFRALHESAEADPEGRRWRVDVPPLGRIADTTYVDLEIHKLWSKAVTAEPDSFSQKFRAALIQALIWSSPENAGQEINGDAVQRVRGLIDACKDGEQLRLAAATIALEGSTFVFQYPELVHLLLERAKSFGILGEMSETLLLSACNIVRTFHEDELAPECRYIQEKATDLANRYRDDPLLAKFFQSIIELERRSLERNRQIFFRREFRLAS